MKQGAELIKLMASGGASTEGSSPTVADYTFEEIQAVVDEAHRNGLKVAAHAHGGEGAQAAIEAGVDSIEHGVFLNEAQLTLMVKKGIFLVVTFGIVKAGTESEEFPEFYRQKTLQAKEQYIGTIAQAIKIGVQIAVGCDTYHAHIGTELQALMEGGYSEAQALQAATLAGAELCGIAGRLGSIKEGKIADLVALAGNPLKDIKTVNEITHVMKEGELIF
jgi:imidazolonepropionase-like amidohydrolase